MIAMDYPVLTTLSAMRRMVNLVPRGYHRYVASVVPLDRAERMVHKFVDIYGVAEPRALERRRRRRGEAITRLILCPDGRLENHRLQWTMIVSDCGGGPIADLEDLLDARDCRHRIRVGWYELVRAPRTGQGMAPSWTWRVPPAEWRVHVEHAVALARHADPTQAQRLIDRELQRPGFRGVRAQRRQMYRMMALARGLRQPPLSFPARRSLWVTYREPTAWRLGDLIGGAVGTAPEGGGYHRRHGVRSMISDRSGPSSSRAATTRVCTRRPRA